MAEDIRYTEQRVRFSLKHGFLQNSDAETYLRIRGHEAGKLAISPWVLHTNSRDELSRGLVYDGRMYVQRSQPTCVPWSIANAQIVKDINPHPTVMRLMLNEATNPSGDYGLTFDKAQRITRSVSSRNFDLNEADLSLTPTIGLPTWRAEDESQRNAARIRKIIAKSRAFLTTVDSAIYSPVEEEGSHAICVAGYLTFKDGETLVQVLDPARGRLWLKVEHFSKSLDMEEVFVVRSRKS